MLSTHATSVAHPTKTAVSPLDDVNGIHLVRDLLLGPTDTAASKAYALSRLCQALCAVHEIEPRVFGVLPLGAKILVANHMSYIDPIAICSVTPCLPIAKTQVASWPAVGTVAARYDVLFHERGNPYSGVQVLRRAARLLASGASVLNFPEGTTTRGELQEFKLGAFGLSRLSQCPVLPIAIQFKRPSLCWVGEQTFAPHYWQMIRTKPHSVELHIGPVLWPNDFSSDADQAAAARAWIRRELTRTDRHASFTDS